VIPNDCEEKQGSAQSYRYKTTQAGGEFGKYLNNSTSLEISLV
jgi:hypothetical protein